jgi:hypothetical protein
MIPIIVSHGNPHLEIGLHGMHHQANGFAHVYGGIENLLNKNNFLLTNVHEISSIEAPTPNIFSLRSNFTTSITNIIHALTIGFN